jgi:triacylglycerol lipase
VDPLASRERFRAHPGEEGPFREEAPVVLLQGLASSVALLRPLEQRLRGHLGVVTLRPSPRLARGDIRDLAMAVHETLLAGGDGCFDVVAHSMGGLVASYLLKCLDHGRRLRRVVALGTPFRGAPLAQLGAFLPGALGRSLRQMTPGSPLLRLLARLPVPAGSELISIGASDDRLVPLAATALPETPGHRHLDAGPLDHLQLVWSRRAFERVAEALGRPPASPRRAVPSRHQRSTRRAPAPKDSSRQLLLGARTTPSPGKRRSYSASASRACQG